MKVFTLGLLAVSGFFLALESATPAAAYDSLCDKIQNPRRRVSCQCRSDLGAAVRRRPNAAGNRLIVDAARLSHRQVPQLQVCMLEKGYGARG